MKSLLALILSITLVAFAAGALAGERGYIVQDNEELYGIWINLSKSRGNQEQIIKPDGTYEYIRGATKGRARYLITGKWKDSQGNIFYRYHCVANGSQGGASNFMCLQKLVILETPLKRCMTVRHTQQKSNKKALFIGSILVSSIF